jgi:hypothetical protein
MNPDWKPPLKFSDLYRGLIEFLKWLYQNIKNPGPKIDN